MKAPVDIEGEIYSEGNYVWIINENNGNEKVLGTFKDGSGRTVIGEIHGFDQNWHKAVYLGDLQPYTLQKSLNGKVETLSSISDFENYFYSNYNFDIVIFYGGFNETFQTLYADPRPGYPFNYWTVGELHPLKFTLLKYSPFFSEIDIN